MIFMMCFFLSQVHYMALGKSLSNNQLYISGLVPEVETIWEEKKRRTTRVHLNRENRAATFVNYRFLRSWCSMRGNITGHWRSTTGPKGHNSWVSGCGQHASSWGGCHAQCSLRTPFYSTAHPAKTLYYVVIPKHPPLSCVNKYAHITRHSTYKDNLHLGFS